MLVSRSFIWNFQSCGCYHYDIPFRSTIMFDMQNPIHKHGKTLCFVFTQTKLINMEFGEFNTTEKICRKGFHISLIQEFESDNVYRMSTTTGNYFKAR